MVLDFGGEIPEIIQVEAANPLDEPELSLHWISEKSTKGNELFREFKAITGQIVGLLLTGGFKNRDHGKLPVKPGILLILR